MHGANHCHREGAPPSQHFKHRLSNGFVFRLNIRITLRNVCVIPNGGFVDTPIAEAVANQIYEINQEIKPPVRPTCKAIARLVTLVQVRRIEPPSVYHLRVGIKLNRNTINSVNVIRIQGNLERQHQLEIDGKLPVVVLASVVAPMLDYKRKQRAKDDGYYG